MIVIVHFGAQYGHLIYRAVTDLGVEAVRLDPETVPNQPLAGITGVILSGGPDSVNAEALRVVSAAKCWQVPVLGICFGHQCLAASAGGRVEKKTRCEYGHATLEMVGESPLFAGLPKRSGVWMSHGDTVTELPNDSWREIGRTEYGRYAAIEHRQGFYGVQFHPEVLHTEHGAQIFRNFVFEICKTPRVIVAADLADRVSHAIRNRVGAHGHLLTACSLGVDSTTLALAANATLGAKRVHPVFVDTGLLREEDLALAIRARESFLPNLRMVDASDRFLACLRGISHRESKRRLVGECFWQVFRETADDITMRGVPLMAYAQGTLAPDVIESGRESGHAAVIKTHHNLVRPPEDFPFPPLEPLKDLYKDQVRVLGGTLGVPREVLSRHPFPGPGLAVRVLGEVTPERVRIARECDAIWITALKEAGHYDVVTQAGIALGNDQASVVRGDEGGDGYLLALWAVTTRDFMTATPALLPLEFITRVSDRIANTVREIGPVHYRTSSKPPVTVEYE